MNIIDQLTALVQSGDPDALEVANDLAIEQDCGLPLGVVTLYRSYEANAGGLESIRAGAGGGWKDGNWSGSAGPGVRTKVRAWAGAREVITAWTGAREY